MALDEVTLVTLDGSRHGRHTGYAGWLSPWQAHWLHWMVLTMAGTLVALVGSWHGGCTGFPVLLLMGLLVSSPEVLPWALWMPLLELLLTCFSVHTYVGRFSLVSAALSQEAPFCLLLATIELSHVFPPISLTARLQYLGLVASLFYELGNRHDTYLKENISLMSSLSNVCPGILSYLCELPVFPPVA